MRLVTTTSRSRTLSGISDLTLLAPVKTGLIESIDSRSYASRARLVMRTLNSLRLSSREAQPTPLVADLVDRVQAIHSFRVVLLERQVLLNVVFDGGWEPYMRRIWRDLGPLLDLIFCNCEGYLLSVDSSFAAYAGWVRSVQVETEFFYTAAPVTVGDLHYLRRAESVRPAAGAPAPGPVPAPAPAPAVAQTLEELLGQALPAVVALYRLSDMHPHDPDAPQTGDGGCLLRAAWRLLAHLDGGLADGQFVNQRVAAITARMGSERAALEWFYRGRPTVPPEPGQAEWSREKVQGGIVEPYASITHGCLVLVGLRDASAARELLDYLLAEKRLVSAAGGGRSPRTGPAPHHNVAFTLQGMQIAGVPVASLATLPAEFREGMAARAGILGDVDTNHPTRWNLPRANWGTPGGPADGTPIELSGVHAVVQIQVAGNPSPDWEDLPGNPEHPLYAPVRSLGQTLERNGVRILAVQAMQRFPASGGQTREAFGFVDGISQPRLEPVDKADRDRVSTGDLLLGHRNGLGDEPALSGRLWDDGTFAVVRKLHQDVEAFERVADNDTKKTALMGRSPTGEVLDGSLNPISGNAFDFKSDPQAKGCPFASHIRRANPREARKPDLPAIPRIVRRGMSWGPRKGKEARGVVFIAYNASIAEQFEVIQGWLAGGNSSGPQLYSGERDPLLGVPQAGDPAVFRYGADSQVFALPPKDRPFAKLEWGLYLFVPSMPALDELRALADEAVRLDDAVDGQNKDERERRQRQARTAVAQAGAALTNRLRRAEQVQSLEATRDLWKTALEDIGARLSGAGEATWAAVADVHGGVLRTPYGVLVGGAKQVQEVLADKQRYTASGYNTRLKRSFGEIFLGMDDRSDSAYAQQAGPVVAALQSISEADAFAAAYDRTCQVVRAAIQGVPASGSRRVEVRDLVDATLAELSRYWFGIPDGEQVVAGGWHWRDQATCPGHFVAPSRYTFQPNPGPEAERIGQAHGRQLARTVKAWFQSLPSGYAHTPIVQAIVNTTPQDVDNQVRNLVGVMMGFLPTVDGNLRGALWEWVEDRSLWKLQLELFESFGAADPAQANEILPGARQALTMPLARTLHLRPVPEVVWRTVMEGHHLGGVDVQPGDTVVVGLVGALQQRLAQERLDLSFLFGGYRQGAGGSADETDLSLLMNPADARSSASTPTHACPAYRMAWGVMLGFLAGLLCSARLRPTLTSMSLQIGPRP